MELSDFTSAIELAAGLNIVYVAAEFASSYTHKVVNKVLKFEEFIAQSKLKCFLHLDEVTLNTLTADDVNGISTAKKLESLKVRLEKEKDNINKLQSELESLIKRKCQSKSFSFIALYLFLFCVLALLFVGFRNVHQFMDLGWSIHSSLSLILVLTVFVCGECKPFFSSLSYCIYIFLFISVLSFSGGYFIGRHHFFDMEILSLSGLFIIITVLAPYSGFIFYWLKMRLIASGLRKEMEMKVTKVEDECIEIEKEINKLQNVQELSMELQNRSDR